MLAIDLFYVLYNAFINIQNSLEFIILLPECKLYQKNYKKYFEEK